MAKKNEQELYEWSVQQAVLYETGQLEDWQIKKLKEIDFPFELYSKEADKLMRNMGSLGGEQE